MRTTSRYGLLGEPGAKSAPKAAKRGKSVKPVKSTLRKNHTVKTKFPRQEGP